MPGVEGGESLSSLQQNRVAVWQRRELENGPGETQIETGSCGFAGAHAARIARPRILLRGTENHAAVTAEDSQQTGRRAEQARRRHGCKAKQVLPLCLGFPESLGNFRQSHKYKKRTHHHQVSKSPQLQKPLVLVLPAIPHRQLRSLLADARTEGWTGGCSPSRTPTPAGVACCKCAGTWPPCPATRPRPAACAPRGCARSRSPRRTVEKKVAAAAVVVCVCGGVW